MQHDTIAKHMEYAETEHLPHNIKTHTLLACQMQKHISSLLQDDVDDIISSISAAKKPIFD